MKPLQLVLKKKWYDMILSGEKTEEYREISEHWVVRIIQLDQPLVDHKFSIRYEKILPAFCYCWGYRGSKSLAINYLLNKKCASLKPFKFAQFTNGYRADSRTMLREIESISIGEGREEWGAESGKKYFVIKLK